MNSKIADGLLLLVAIIWGGGFPAVGLAVQEGVGAGQLITLRFLIAGGVLAIVFRKQLLDLKRIDVVAGVLAGICLFIGFTFQTIGMQYTTASKNAFITSSYVLLVPLFGVLFFKNKMKGSQWIGMLVMILGISILSLERDFSVSIGDLLTLICAIGFALQIIITGLYINRCNSYCFTIIQMVTVAMVSLIWSLISEPWAALSFSSGLASMYLGIFSTLLAYLLQTIAQRYTSEAKAGLILSTEALFGAILSVMILHDPITNRLVFGGLICLIAILMIEFDFCHLKSSKLKSKIVAQKE